MMLFLICEEIHKTYLRFYIFSGSKTLYDEENIGRVLSDDRDYGLTEEDIKVVKIGMSLCMYSPYLILNLQHNMHS